MICKEEAEGENEKEKESSLIQTDIKLEVIEAAM
jgi:hypothetical protein